MTMIRHPIESELERLIDLKRAEREGKVWTGSSEQCDLCNQSIAGHRFMIDGQTKSGSQTGIPSGQSMGPWAFMCTRCFATRGVEIKWGFGQLYQWNEAGLWSMVAGFRPDDELKKKVTISAKKVTIPAKVENGNLVQQNGQKLPSIVDGSEVKIIAYANDILYSASDFLQKEEKTILEAKTELLVKIKTQSAMFKFLSQYGKTYDEIRKMPGELTVEQFEYLKEINREYGIPFLAAKIQILNDLVLSTYGYKSSTLMNCPINIPFLNKKAVSVNQAYTIISTEFEKNRRSHTGNVFDKVYYKDDNTNRWLKLDNLRPFIVQNPRSPQ
jgi:hypothetical protein